LTIIKLHLKGIKLEIVYKYLGLINISSAVLGKLVGPKALILFTSTCFWEKLLSLSTSKIAKFFGILLSVFTLSFSFVLLSKVIGDNSNSGLLGVFSIFSIFKVFMSVGVILSSLG
jgi:hypothetical protein